MEKKEVRTVHEIIVSQPMLNEDNLHPDIAYFLFKWGFYFNDGLTPEECDKEALEDCWIKGADVMKILVYLFSCQVISGEMNSPVSSRKAKLFELQKSYIEKMNLNSK